MSTQYTSNHTNKTWIGQGDNQLELKVNQIGTANKLNVI